MRKTVDHKILTELKYRKKVSTVCLGHRSGSFAVHSAIARLRAKGWDIRCEMTGNNSRKAWYSLASNESEVSKSQKTISKKRHRIASARSSNKTKCKKHPKYKVIRAPRAACQQCRSMFENKQKLQKSQSKTY